MEQVKHTVWCPGWFRLPGKEHRYRDWKRGGHGRVGLKRAIVESCDVFFYELALGLGIDRINAFMERFGFGQPTGIDLEGESSGLNPSRRWKEGAKGRPWYPGETLITGIGQGFSLATPLQLAHATATLAVGGVKIEPRIVMRKEASFRRSGSEEVLAPAHHVSPQNPANWQQVVEAMESVVHGPRGTARRIGVDAAYRIAGKTGTAQVFTVGQEEKYEAESLEKKLRDHGLFIAFAPIERPRIAVAVLVENGGSGSRAAAPLVRQVMDYYLRSESAPGRDDRMIITAAQVGRHPVH